MLTEPRTTTARIITDTRTTIETPEGAELPLDPAGICIRVNAFIIDSLIKGLVSTVLFIVLAFAGLAGIGVYLILYFLLEWFYPVFFEVWRQGQTPGKKSSKIMVVNDDGTPVTFGASLIRNLLRFVDFMPLGYTAAMVSMTLNGRFQRLGDIAGGTLVVYCHEKPEIPELDIKGKKQIPTDFTTDEQRALLSFAERSARLSEGRQQELANILKPILGEGDLVNDIKKMANSALGGR